MVCSFGQLHYTISGEEFLNLVTKMPYLCDMWCFANAYVLLQNRDVNTVEVSHKKLWKILIDKDMKKKDLQAVAGISWASVTKLSKGETVSMDVLMKVCKALNCNIGDVVDLIPEDENRE